MMKVFEFIEVVARFHQYVMRENTGNAEAFAKKLGISRASLYNLINELETYGIEIDYSRTKETYYYRFCEKVKIILLIQQE